MNFGENYNHYFFPNYNNLKRLNSSINYLKEIKFSHWKLLLSSIIVNKMPYPIFFHFSLISNSLFTIFNKRFSSLYIITNNNIKVARYVRFFLMMKFYQQNLSIKNKV